MENSFKSLTDSTKSILILLPTRPYFDQAAAGLSLFLALRSQKEVQISSPTPITVELNRLIGVNKITSELGNKNLVIRFMEYKANDIERVSYDIEDGQFKLTVIPKQNINPPNKDQVQLSYSGISAQTVILIGGANDSHFPALASKDLVAVNLIHLGTKDISLPAERKVISFARPASSTSEIASQLIFESGLPLDEDIATNLLMGIEEGSSGFSDAGVTADTFALFAELMRRGGRRGAQRPQTQAANFPPGAIPGVQTTFAQQPMQTGQPGNSQAQKQTQQDDSSAAPQDWLEPKIFKGTSIK